MSLTTVEIAADEGGTRVAFTEQGVFFGTEEDVARREEGSGWLLDRLGASLTSG